MVSFKGIHDTVTVWTDDGNQETQKAVLGDAPTRSTSIILSIVFNWRRWQYNQFFQVLQLLSQEWPVDWWYPHNISVNAWFMKISSWSLRHFDKALTGMKFIFHLGNIIQLIYIWVHACHTVFCIYTCNLP